MTSNGHPSRVFGIINHTWSYLYIHSQGTGINLQLQFPPQTKSAKILWLGLVCLGFTGAGILIGKSYMEWQEKPIATTITTYPIDDLQFPQVTICPPKDSNTALYHDLVKAGNKTLSDEIRKTLRKAAYDIFIEQTHMAYTKAMLGVSNRDNVDQIFQGFHSVPTPYNDESGLKIKITTDTMVWRRLCGGILPAGQRDPHGA